MSLAKPPSQRGPRLAARPWKFQLPRSALPKAMKMATVLNQNPDLLAKVKRSLKTIGPANENPAAPVPVLPQRLPAVKVPGG